jgi:hypothetical protein
METALSAMQVQRKVFTVEYSLNMVAVLSTITFSAYFHTTVTDRIICDCELKGIITVTISHATCSDTNWWFNFILKVYSLVLQSGLFQFSCLVTDWLLSPWAKSVDFFFFISANRNSFEGTLFDREWYSICRAQICDTDIWNLDRKNPNNPPPPPQGKKLKSRLRYTASSVQYSIIFLHRCTVGSWPINCPLLRNQIYWALNSQST